MTKTRIRYKNNVSTTFFPAIKGNVRVVLYPALLIYELRDVTNNELVARGESKDLSSLKKAAKNCLIDNGVVFEKEERERLEKIVLGLKAEGIHV